VFENFLDNLRVLYEGFQNPMLARVRCNSHLVFRDIRQEYNIPSDKMIVIYSAIGGDGGYA